MALFQLNPWRAVLRYMRGDDIKEADAAAVVKAQAALAAEASAASTPSISPPAKPVIDRRRM